MINSEKEAKNAVNKIKYPPIGSRGVGLARAQGYGFNFEQYAKTFNENILIIAQIEHYKAIENLEKLLTLKE